MYLGNLFIAKTEVEFRSMDTTDERQLHLERLANEMLWQNRHKCVLLEPEFYVEANSRMRECDFKTISWKEIYLTTPGIKEEFLPVLQMEEQP